MRFPQSIPLLTDTAQIARLTPLDIVALQAAKIAHSTPLHQVDFSVQQANRLLLASFLLNSN